MPRRRRQSEAQRRKLALEQLTFSVAECVWLTDQEEPDLRYAVRVDPDGRGGYLLNCVELGR